MPQCAVATCRNSHRKTKGRRVRYHRFPAEESVRERWVAVCGRSTIFNTTTARVCSLHFSAPSYERDVEHELLGLPPRSRLRRGAVPDLYVPVSVPSLIKKLNSAPPLSRSAALGGHTKNYVGKQQQHGGKLKCGAHPVMSPPTQPCLPESQCDVLLALGLVPRNNNSWGSPLINVHRASSAGGRMPVMEASKPRSRAASLDTPPRAQENGVTSRGEQDEAVSEGEGVARAAAALVSVKVDVDEAAQPIVFRGDGAAAVKEEPVEQATSSGCGSEEEDDMRIRGGKRARAEGAGEGGEKRARLEEEPLEEEDDRERMLRGFVEAACGEGSEEAARCAESLRSELNMLRALAEAKEREWNQVIRMRSLKEEMLLRLERRRAVMSMSGRGQRSRSLLAKPTVNGAPNSVIGEGRQGPILDVRSIIADYRSRHPEAVPRRGRRLKPGGSPAPSELSELGSLLSEALRPADTSRPSSADSTRSGVPQAEPSISFKDVLVKFAKMSQSEQQQQQSRLPYPEVTLHPVPPVPSLGPASSLLQGILSKPGQASQATQGGNHGASIPRATNFSPTLARLLTAPERPTPQSSSANPPVSIADLLGPSKQGRTEITITPVASQAGKPARAPANTVVNLEGGDEEEEGPEGGDRLVIDEAANETSTTREASSETRVGRREQDSEEDEEDVPECQGCHRHQAQFVCAGCGNQWYCSRECQVTAWDEHSEVCSG